MGLSGYGAGSLSQAGSSIVGGTKVSMRGPNATKTVSQVKKL